MRSETHGRAFHAQLFPLLHYPHTHSLSSLTPPYPPLSPPLPLPYDRLVYTGFYSDKDGCYVIAVKK